MNEFKMLSAEGPAFSGIFELPQSKFNSYLDLRFNFKIQWGDSTGLLIYIYIKF